MSDQESAPLPEKQVTEMADSEGDPPEEVPEEAKSPYQSKVLASPNIEPAVPKPPPPLIERKELLLPVKELTAKMGNRSITCEKCKESYSLVAYFVHVTNTHDLFPCLYCCEVFKFAKELMVHLHREHRVPPQKFVDGKDFVKQGGTSTTLLCVECNAIFQILPGANPNDFSSHECIKNVVGICPKCGSNVPTKSLAQHLEACDGSMDMNLNLNGNAALTTSQIRSQDSSCQYCGKKISPSKIGAHLRACSARKVSGVVSPTKLTATPDQEVSPGDSCPEPSIKIKPMGKKSPPLLLPATFSKQPLASFNRLHHTSPPKLGPINQGAARGTQGRPPKKLNLPFFPGVTVTAVPNDGDLTQDSFRPTEVSPGRPKRLLRPVSNDEYLYQSVGRGRGRRTQSAVSIVPVPPGRGRRSLPKINTGNVSKARSKTIPSLVTFDYDIAGVERFEQGQPPDPEFNDDSEMEMDPEPDPEIKLDPLLLESDPKKRLDMLIEQLSENLSRGRAAEGEEGEFKHEVLFSGNNLDQIPVELILNTFIEKTSEECDYCRQVKTIRIDRRQLLIHLLSKHDWVVRLDGPEPSSITELKSETKNEEAMEVGQIPIKIECPEAQDVAENGAQPVSEEKMECAAPTCDENTKHSSKSKIRTEENCLALVPYPIPLNEPIDWKAFQDRLLRHVFHSTDLVFTYTSPSKVGFGQGSCECLICGVRVDSPLDFFPHWRKFHRNMTMKCVMCHGKFLFAGALFSHLCLGTPQHFVTPSSGGKVGSSTSHALVKTNGLDGPIEGETSSDTIVLRYQCGLCPSLQLPSFFNYMVHLRRDHLTCELCLESLPNQQDLEHHMKKHKLNHFCWKCCVTYCAKPNFMTHLFWKHGTESTECSKCLKKKWAHIYHFCIPPPWFPCEVCGIYFLRARSLIVHRRLHTGKDLKQCPDCDEAFVSKSLLQKHVQIKHENRMPAIKEFKSDTEEEDGEDGRKANGHLGKEPHDAVAEDDPTVPSPIVPMEEGVPADAVTNSAGLVFGSEADHISTFKVEKVDDLDPLDRPVHSKDLARIITDQSNTELTEPPSRKLVGTPDEGPLVLPKEVEKAYPSTVEPTDADAESEPASNSIKVKKTKKSKKKKKSDADKFRIERVLGPNLSEDESSSSAADDEHPLPLPPPPTRIVPTGFPLSDSDDSDALSDSVVMCRSLDVAKDLELTDEEGYNEKPSPVSQAVEPKQVSAVIKPMRSPEAMPPPQFPIKHENVLSGPRRLTGGETPRLDLCSTATVSLFDEESKFGLCGPLSPLLHPLDQFNLSVPEIPTFEENSLPDHISYENALFTLEFEHTYCLRFDNPDSLRFLGGVRMYGSRLPRKISPTQKSPGPVQPPPRLHGVPPAPTPVSVPPAKRLKVRPPIRPKAEPTKPSKKRKRLVSSSSSSSSSSCSSCGSNCSCSSGSSSSSSSSNSSSYSGSDSGPSRPKVQAPVPAKKKKVLKVKVKAPPKPKKLKPVKDPSLPKRPKGRPPKGTKRLKFMGEYQHQIPTTENGLGAKGEEILKHFARTEDAYIHEDDLQTDDSGSEENFHRKQIMETIDPEPPLIDEPWTAGNEKFLLKYVRGVCELEELRPKPKFKQNGESRYSPIKPLIVRRSIGQNDEFGYNTNHAQSQVMIGNTPLFGKGALQTSLTSNVNNTTITITRGLPTAATAVPASALVKGNRARLQNKALSLPFPPKSNGEASPNAGASSSVPPVTPVPSEPGSGSTTPASGAPKPRRARMRITPINPQPVVPTPPVVEEVLPPVQEEVKLYCICQGPHDNVSQMIGCDDEECPYQWFHFECVGILVAPKGKWYCSDCKERRKKKQRHSKGGGGGSGKSPRSRGSPMNNNFIGHSMP